MSDARKALELEVGRVWNTQELQRDYKVLGFLAPFVKVQRLEDGKAGVLEFQHSPRFYHTFREHAL